MLIFTELKTKCPLGKMGLSYVSAFACYNLECSSHLSFSFKVRCHTLDEFNGGLSYWLFTVNFDNEVQSRIFCDNNEKSSS